MSFVGLFFILGTDATSRKEEERVVRSFFVIIFYCFCGGGRVRSGLASGVFVLVFSFCNRV